MATTEAVKVAVRFLLELGALAGLSYWAFGLPQATGMRIVAALVAPTIAAVVWGLLVAPRRRLQVAAWVRPAAEVAVFGAATAAIWASGRPVVAIVYGLAVAASAVSLADHADVAAVSRWLRPAGIVYVLGWLAGLLAAPARPDLAATAAEVHSYYLANAGPVVMQSLLVHGIAGLALAVVATGLGRRLGGGGGRAPSVTIAGLVAAALSVGQFVTLLVLVADVTGRAPATTLALRTAIDLTDVVKLAALAVFVATTSVVLARSGRAPFWLRTISGILVLLLPLSALSLLPVAAIPAWSLGVALVLLLAWIGSVTWIVGAADAAGDSGPVHGDEALPREATRRRRLARHA